MNEVRDSCSLFGQSQVSQNVTMDQDNCLYKPGGSIGTPSCCCLVLFVYPVHILNHTLLNVDG